jgi:hypothetical protein
MVQGVSASWTFFFKEATMADSCYSKILVWGTLTKAQWQAVRDAVDDFVGGGDPNFDSSSGAASFESEYANGLENACMELQEIKGVRYLATSDVYDGLPPAMSWWDGSKLGGSNGMGDDYAAIHTCDVLKLVRTFRGLKPEDMPLIIAMGDSHPHIVEACEAIMGGQDFLEWLDGWLTERTEIDAGKLVVDGKEGNDILEA